MQIERIAGLYDLDGYDIAPIEAHEGGRNTVFMCVKAGVKRFVLRVSQTGDRTLNDYLAETEFVRYLAQNGASVADVILSRNNKLVETMSGDDKPIYVSLFNYAKGMQLCDNGYRYIDGAPLSEYMYSTGKVLGRIHHLSKRYAPAHRRFDCFDIFNNENIRALIPDTYAPLKRKILEYIEVFRKLKRDESNYGLVHFDYSDGNYNIDYDTGELTVFDFDNACYCWYMYDLANLYTHLEGWVRGEKDSAQRKARMDEYFDATVKGYRSETEIDDYMLSLLPLFIDMAVIENIYDAFTCHKLFGEELDEDYIAERAECLRNGIPYKGLFE